MDGRAGVHVRRDVPDAEGGRRKRVVWWCGRKSCPEKKSGSGFAGSVPETRSLPSRSALLDRRKGRPTRRLHGTCTLTPWSRVEFTGHGYALRGSEAGEYKLGFAVEFRRGARQAVLVEALEDQLFRIALINDCSSYRINE